MPNKPTDVLRIQVPTLLNLAWFVTNKGGLETHAGYLGRALHWPYQERGFRDRVTSSLFIQAGYEWHQW